MARFPLGDGAKNSRGEKAGSGQLPSTVIAGSQAFRAPVIVFDDFNRADTAPGTIGSPEVGSAWLYSGSGFAGVQIVNKRVISPTGTTYVYQTMPQVPRHYSANFSLTGSLPGAAFAMILSADATLTLTNMLHCNFFPGGGGCTIWTATNGGNQQLAVPCYFATALPNDGRVLRADVWVDPVATTVQVQVIDTTTSKVLVVVSGSDPGVPAVIGPTPLIIVEPVTNGPGSSTLYQVQVDSPAAPAGYDRDLRQPGMWAPSTPAVFASAISPTANVIYLGRFVPSRTMSVTSMAVQVSTASNAADTSDVGIYGIGVGSTLTRLGSAGSVTGRFSTTGVKNVALTATTTLLGGQVYYAALAGPTAFGTAAPVLSGVTDSSSLSAGFGTNPPAVELTAVVGAAPLPASIAYGSLATQGASFRFAIRES